MNRLFSVGAFVEGLRRTSVLTILITALFLIISLGMLSSTDGLGSLVLGYENLSDAYPLFCLPALVALGLTLFSLTAIAKRYDFYASLPIHRSAVALSSVTAVCVQMLISLLFTITVTVFLKSVTYTDAEPYFFIEYLTVFLNTFLSAANMVSIAFFTLALSKNVVASLILSLLIFYMPWLTVATVNSGFSFSTSVSWLLSDKNVFPNSTSLASALFSLCSFIVFIAAGTVLYTKYHGTNAPKMLLSIFASMPLMLLAGTYISEFLIYKTDFTLNMRYAAVFLASALFISLVCHVIYFKGFKRMLLYFYSIIIVLGLFLTSIFGVTVSAVQIKNGNGIKGVYLSDRQKNIQQLNVNNCLITDPAALDIVRSVIKRENVKNNNTVYLDVVTASGAVLNDTPFSFTVNEAVAFYNAVFSDEAFLNKYLTVPEPTDIAYITLSTKVNLSKHDMQKLYSTLYDEFNSLDLEAKKKVLCFDSDTGIQTYKYNDYYNGLDPLKRMLTVTDKAGTYIHKTDYAVTPEYLPKTSSLLLKLSPTSTPQQLLWALDEPYFSADIISSDGEKSLYVSRKIKNSDHIDVKYDGVRVSVPIQAVKDFFNSHIFSSECDLAASYWHVDLTCRKDASSWNGFDYYTSRLTHEAIVEFISFYQ